MGPHFININDAEEAATLLQDLAREYRNFPDACVEVFTSASGDLEEDQGLQTIRLSDAASFVANTIQPLGQTSQDVFNDIRGVLERRGVDLRSFDAAINIDPEDYKNHVNTSGRCTVIPDVNARTS